MSILKWITGGTFTEHRDAGEQLFQSGEFGEARLAFQRAVKKAKGISNDEISAIKDKIEVCAEKLAFLQIERAREEFGKGEVDGAYEILEDALLISNSPSVSVEVERCRKSFDETEAQAAADEEKDMSDDDLLAVIAGGWSSDMATEFNSYPEAFFRALMVAHDGEVAEAVKMLEVIESEIDLSKGLYFWLEKGRLQMAADDMTAAEVSFRRFVDAATADADNRVEELWIAWQMLATIYSESEEYEKAENALMSSYRAAPDNHVPLLHLGVFLRERGELERSLRTLNNAMDTMGSIHPDMRVFREMGLTYVAMAQKQKAMDCFKTVLDHCCHTVGHDQYDPEAAVPLAILYEADGKLQEASDIYRHLTAGYDTENYFKYNYEAARLLLAQGADKKLVNKYLDEAAELAEGEFQRETVSVLLAQAE